MDVSILEDYHDDVRHACLFQPTFLFEARASSRMIEPTPVPMRFLRAKRTPPEIERQPELGKEVVFPADAAFAKPEIYETLEERGVKYAIRLPANAGRSGTSRNC